MMKALAYSLTAALIVAFVGVSAQAEERMLAHDVYFGSRTTRPRPSRSWSSLARSTLRITLAPSGLQSGPLAEEMMRDVNDRDFDVALHVVFKDKASHDQYSRAQRHLKFIEDNKDNWKKVRVFDSYLEP